MSLKCNVTSVNILRHKLRLSNDTNSRIVEIGLMQQQMQSLFHNGSGTQNFESHISYRNVARGPFHAIYVWKYSSTQALNLQKHKLTHSDEKPYSCNQCNISCKQAGCLKSHICKSTVKKNLTHVINVTTSVKTFEKTQDKEACCKNIEVKELWRTLNCSKYMTTFKNTWHLNDFHY